MLLYFCFATVIGLALSLGLLSANEDRALMNHGKATYAQVVSKNIKVNHYSTDYYLNYRYKVGTTLLYRPCLG